MTSTGSGLAVFNEMPAQEATAALRTCCTSHRWVEALVSRRPFQGQGLLLVESDQAVERLEPPDVDQALAGHARAEHQVDNGTWSASERPGTDVADPETRRRIAEGNRRYEERFGRVYLVSASGRTDSELLAILNTRLENDAATEYAVTKSELAKINRLRLVKLLERLSGGTDGGLT